jgi:2-isopropylmalate synthase
MFVTEDTTRATPDSLKALYQTAIRAGAERITVADTAGHADPAGVRAILAYVRSIADEARPGVLLDWHGHNDRGLGVINTLTAAVSGADQVHGTALGVGERCGNAALDQVLVNLKLMGVISNDLSRLATYCDTVARALKVGIGFNYPVVGRDAFRTATGVHAAAVIKAAQHGDAWLEDMIYSAVPAGMIGRVQEIEIGPMSGVSNVTFWLNKRGIEPSPQVVESIFAAAKKGKTVLEEREILRLAREAGADISD